MWYNKGTMPKCIQCQEEIKQHKFANKRQKFCSLKCKSTNYYKKYYKHFIWQKERECLFCGKSFIPIRINQVNCSIRCRGKKWKKKNWNKILKQQSEWFKKDRKKNPEKYRMFVKNRKHFKRQTSCSGKTFSKDFTLQNWIDIKNKFNNRCVICKEEKKLTIDHIMPLSKGGRHCIKNIQPLCHSCNSRKKDIIPSSPL